jgi:hypothetical protein
MFFLAQILGLSQPQRFLLERLIRQGFLSELGFGRTADLEEFFIMGGMLGLERTRLSWI